MHAKYLVTLFVLFALMMGVAGITARAFGESAALAPNGSAPLAGGCTPGATYDPACDADQDGDVDIFDIQLTAGHWNQTGTWTGGDSWLLTGNAGTDPTNNFLGTTDAQPLVIQPGDGNVGIGTIAPQSKLSVNGTGWFQGSSTPLPAAAGEGVGIGYMPGWQAGYLFAFDYGTFTPRNLWLQSPGGKVGVGVTEATPMVGKLQVSAGAGEHGVAVGTAGYDGMRVAAAGNDGLHVTSANNNGVFVSLAGGDGVQVGSAGFDGVYVVSAGYDGVYANTAQANHEWGIYTPDKIYAGTALASNGPLLLVAQSGDRNRLETGDLVVVSSTGATLGESESPLPLVRRASPGDSSVMGVVYRRFVAEEKVEEIEEDGQGERQTRLDTRSAEGPVAPGETLLVVVLGPAQVKVDGATPIAAGQPLTVATDGRARPLGTITVQLAGDAGTADLPEGAPVIGVGMGPAQDGLVWVLVNPH